MSDDDDNVDDDTKRRKSPTLAKLMTSRIELFLLMLTAVDKVTSLIRHCGWATKVGGRFLVGARRRPAA
ncbi:hypothetical protein [Amycolatopsis sp. NPDC051372]|uniref:hypothetical protein n=1 Tax=Amycolatopsis sp. NPDC051372 TaxID=3155669 RepID=UPI00341328E9